MKVVMVMYDSLNRHFLPNYGCDWTHAPNFKRLGERTVTFDQSYVCSMPCMPARRDLHTGRPNFLHRSWGPIEPFDDSVPAMLRDQGIWSHLATDHYHYFEDGGCTYHTQYTTWENFRGHEMDPWIAKVCDPSVAVEDPLNQERRVSGFQEWINRQYMLGKEERQPQHHTFKAGLKFIERNHDKDNWFLQIETFDPHEPFFSHRRYKDLYAEHYARYDGEQLDWPMYCASTDKSPQTIEHVRHEYASLMAMCDYSMGQVLDALDRHEMWEDTMLIVWTDHGFMLGEHDCWAKCWMPFYEEVSHTPFFVWDPRSGKRGERRQSLVQPSIDLGPTLLGYFGQSPTKDMLGCDLAGVIDRDESVREAAIFGRFGANVNVTDGRYVYMRGPANDANQPLFEHTLMPTHMNHLFSPEEFVGAQLVEPLRFTKGAPVLRLPADGGRWHHASLLFDLESDPQQLHPLEDQAIEQKMMDHMVKLMQVCDAPSDQYERLGLQVQV